MGKDSKLERIIDAALEGAYWAYDYNGEQCGFYYLNNSYGDPTHLEVGDHIELGAAPNSKRECEDGAVTITVLDKREVKDYAHYQIKIIDNLGNIGSYPNFEWFQNYDVSGTYIITVLPNGQWSFGKEFDVEKVRRRCRDLLNKTQDTETILKVAGDLGAKVWG